MCGGLGFTARPYGNLNPRDPGTVVNFPQLTPRLRIISVWNECIKYDWFAAYACS
jgi:hypothetical protein